MTDSETLKAWVHWKRLELQKHPSQEDQEFVEAVNDLLSQVGTFKEAFVRERAQADILKRELERAKDERNCDNNVAMRWRDELADELAEKVSELEGQLEREIAGREEDNELLAWSNKERQRLVGLIGKVQSESVALIIENEQRLEDYRNYVDKHISPEDAEFLRSWNRRKE